MEKNALFKSLLNLPGVEILDVQVNQEGHCPQPRILAVLGDRKKATIGVMWFLRTTPRQLTAEEWETLTLLFLHSPSLKLAYEFSHQLTTFFNQKTQRSRVRHKIDSWIRRVKKSGLKCFDSFLSTLAQKMEEMLNYFIGRQSSGFVEGLNNKIKVIKRRCYEIFRTGQLFRQIYLEHLRMRAISL